MRPGYETTDRRNPALESAVRGEPPGYITETLANGHILQTMVGTEAARERYGPGARAGAVRPRRRMARGGDGALSQLQALANSGDPAVALRARQLMLLHLAG